MHPYAPSDVLGVDVKSRRCTPLRRCTVLRRRRLFVGRGSWTLVRKERRVGPDLIWCWSHPPDPLTDASYVGEECSFFTATIASSSTVTLEREIMDLRSVLLTFLHAAMVPCRWKYCSFLMNDAFQQLVLEPTFTATEDLVTSTVCLHRRNNVSPTSCEVPNTVFVICANMNWPL